MKKLLILTLLVLLSGCVTYYYPETALEDGVYYAEDDPSYVVYQGGYPGAAYYPWSSLDYFYMGFNPYPRHAYYYGFPFGFAYGYSPWHYPYGFYGYYSPLYASHYHYPHFPVWRPYNGYCSHYSGCGRWNQLDGRTRGGKRHASNAGGDVRDHDDKEADDNENPVDSQVLPVEYFDYSTPAYGRYVSKTSPAYSGNRGLLISSSKTTKIGKSRIQPAESGPSSNGIVTAVQSSQTILASGHRGAGEQSATALSTRPVSRQSPSTPVSRSRDAATPRMSSRNNNRSAPGIRSSSHRTPRNSTSPVREKRD